MSADDFELERLKARRLAEMQQNIQSKKAIEQDSNQDGNDKKDNPRVSARSLLVGRLGFRGLEVLENAEAQFPHETMIIVQRLSELIKTGELDVTIDGGQLLVLFRSIGLHVRMTTKINIEQDGKFVSLGEKLRSQSQNDDDHTN